MVELSNFDVTNIDKLPQLDFEDFYWGNCGFSGLCLLK